MTSKTRSIETINTAFQIIEEMQETGSIGVTGLARKLDLPRSTVHSHLTTLEQRGYLVRDGDAYQLGIRFLGIGESARTQRQLYQFARSEVDDLAEETGEVSSVMVEEHGLGMFLYKTQGDKQTTLDSYSGYQIYLHTTAVGKAILAHLPRHEVDEIMDEHGLPAETSNTITDRTALYEELDEIHERGIAFDDEERLRGLRGVAAPILSTEGRALGSISIAGPTGRIQGETFHSTYPQLVTGAANAIELSLVHSPV